MDNFVKKKTVLNVKMLIFKIFLREMLSTIAVVQPLTRFLIILIALVKKIIQKR